MIKTIFEAYAILFFLCLFTVIISRMYLLIKLFNIKAITPDQIASKEEDLVGIIASIVLPHAIKEDQQNKKANAVIKNMNKLKNVYWILMGSLVIFIISLNVLEHQFGYKVFD